MEYVKRKEVLRTLGICYKTLYKMAEEGEIETIKIGHNKLYNLKKYMRERKIMFEKKKDICYCRVSSNKQKEDLKRQIEYMEEKYPKHEIINDIGSGINMKRKGLKKIMKMAISGEINELVIAYKDRLARFGYEMIEWLIEEYSNGKIKVINKEEERTPNEEMTEDIISIMNIYVAKVNGLRKYKKEIKETMRGEGEK